MELLSAVKKLINNAKKPVEVQYSQYVLVPISDLNKLKNEFHKTNQNTEHCQHNGGEDIDIDPTPIKYSNIFL